MKKVIVLIAISFVIFGCHKNVSKPANSQQSFSVSNSVNDTIPEPKKKGVCEGCSHQ